MKVPSGVTVYTGTISEDEGTLNLTELQGDVIPAETAVILKGDEDSYTFEVTTGGETVTGNDLKGGLGSATPGSILTLQPHPDTDTEVFGFYKYNNEEGLPAFKAYLDWNERDPLSIKGITFGEDTTDGIATVEGRVAESAAIYNLSGQRVEKAVKGVYIVNGKKVLVK